jgi:hypothetical protein
MAANKLLSADRLFALVRASFEQMTDQRAENAKISMADALMSGFAMFSLNWTSLHCPNYMQSATCISMILPDTVLIRHSLNRRHASTASLWTQELANGSSVITTRSALSL